MPGGDPRGPGRRQQRGRDPRHARARPPHPGTPHRQHAVEDDGMDPHTAAELDLEQIWNLVDDLTEAHGTWLPEWARGSRKQKVA